MVVVLCFLANLDVTTDFGAIYLLCIVMAVCGATQDIATDALVCSLLTEEERGMGNGIQTAGGMFGYMVGAGLLLKTNPNHWLAESWDCTGSATTTPLGAGLPDRR